MEYLGALTFAIGDDYQNMAAVQAQSWARIGIPMTVVIAGRATPALLHSEANIVQLNREVTKPFEFEKYAYELSPYTVTIKTDADLVVPWMWRPTPLMTEMPLISGKPIQINGASVENSPYRETATKFLGLPEVYSAFFTFRKGPDASTFFRYVDEIFTSYYLTDLPNVEATPSTDFVYSVAWARLFSSSDLGYTLPFHHMKHGVHGLGTVGHDWSAEANLMVTNGDIFINGYQVYHPLHYHNKDLASRFL